MADYIGQYTPKETTKINLTCRNKQLEGAGNVDSLCVAVEYAIAVPKISRHYAKGAPKPRH